MKLRAIEALVLSAFIATALQWPSVSAAQQALPSFADVDFFYAQQPQLFQELWQRAESQTVRIAVLGDSQETSPNSHGFQYIPLLNYEMWKRFGNVPETPVVGCFPYGTTTPGNWLLAGVCGTPGPVATRLAASQILPNARPRAFSTLNSSANITGGSRGQLTMLQHDASGVDASAEIPANISYFNTSGIVKARIYAATNPSSGEIAYQARPNHLSSPSYTAAVTTTGTLSLGLQSSTFAIKSGTTSALNFNGNDYMALEVFGSSDAELTDLVGLRFVNETHPEGVVIDTFSLGGYTATNFLNAHADAGAMFRALGFDAAVIHYGANEGTSLTAAQFQSNISSVISRLRNWAGDVNFPIILISDVYQSRLTAPQATEYDQFVGAQLAIAQADPNVLVINARRLTQDIGWNSTSGQSNRYLDDGVHYTGLGAQVLAKAVVAAMLGEIRTDDCPNDPGAVTLQSAMTLVVKFGGTSACTNHGRLTVARSLTLNQPVLKMTLTNGFAPAAGDQFKILSFASVTGTFGSISLPTLASNLSWNISDLYTTGTIKVVSSAAPPNPPDPPDPPNPLPNPPTISMTSGVSQAVTLPSSPSPIDFTLNGSGTLTVTANSSNTQLLPNSSISISAGCGMRTMACSASLSPTSGQTGTTTVSLTVTDASDQSASTSTTIIISPAAAEPATGGGSGTGNGNGTGGTGNVTSTRGGGGGSMDLVLLSVFCSLLILNKGLRRTWRVS